MPGDKFSRDVLELRITDFKFQISMLTDYASKKDLTSSLSTALRDEVKTLQNELRSLQLEINKHNVSAKTPTEVVDKSPLDTYANQLFEIICKCCSVDPPTVKSASKPVENATGVMPLEKLNLFIWDGDISKWNSWFSLFKSTVDCNPNLDSEQKFVYMKRYLTGEPLAICDGLEVNGSNYGKAIDMLKDRYQKERRLGFYHLAQLINYKKKYPGSDLSKFLTVFRSSAAALKNLSRITDLADFMLFYIAYINLDDKMQRDFDMSRPQGSDVHKFDDLLQYVQFATTNQEISHDAKFEIPKETKKEDPKFKVRFKSNFSKNQNKHFVGITEAKASTSKSPQEKSCPMCSKTHKLYLCPKFKTLSADRRNELVVQWRRCLNCLGPFHNTCPSTMVCYVCNKSHHTLLHKDAASGSAVVSCTTSLNRQVLLGTIQCEIKDSFHSFSPVRILLDSGAQTSVVSYELIKKLGLPFQFSANFIKGLAENKISALGHIDLIVRPRQSPEMTVSVNAVVLKRKSLCGNLPARDVPEEIKNKFKHLDLADPDFIKSSKIDLILGADILPKILQPGAENIFTHANGLLAIKTIFGFVIAGAVPASSKEAQEVLVSTVRSPLEATMEKFWKSEEVLASSIENPEEVYCERLFTSTTKRLPDGRFSVRLPFKPGVYPEKLKNCSSAINSYKNLERRLNKDESLRSQYLEQIRSYLELEQMVPCDFGTASYILPQLVVVRESALTTQVRICFNASSPAFVGPALPRASLNDFLLTGPKLQTDLNSILTRFRLNKVGLMADVEMMFRRVSVAPEDRKYLHILYRDSPDARLEELEFTVLPFGLRCSPYLAQRTVHELLNVDGHHFPEAAAALRKNLYVDDFVGSMPSVEDAIRMKDNLTQLMRRGGFNLRKWASSHSDVLQNTSAENKGKICFDNENRTMKVLGLQWDALEDSFCYKILEFTPPVTKRNCLSYIARTFDCLGLVAPVVFWMKLFLQKLWTLKIDWDDPLPDYLVEKWNCFAHEISALEKIRIPRCILENDAEVFLAAFSDGSQVGYAACIYLVAKYPNGRVSSNLLTSKSKLAPLSTISIPRLELNGALLMSQLCRHVLQALDNLQIKDIYLFTDSQIVLAWVRTPPFQLKTYVANRVSKIQELTQGMEWRYVSTHDNPSDSATRGLFPTQLHYNPLWWAGPDFLQQDPRLWANQSVTSELEIPETKENTILVFQNNVQDSFFTELLNRCSTFGKLQRVLAYILRYKYNTRAGKNEKRTGALQVVELKEALTKCVLMAQQQDMEDEIKSLKLNKSPSKRLMKLSPYIDEEGIMRVGGRLGNALLSESEKHPILLLKNSPLSKLICEHYHQILLHTGPRTTRAAIQRRFWITSLHSLLRKIIHRCPRCIRWHAKPNPPEMGTLPASRVRPSRCFASTTMDMAGPFTVTEARRRKSPQHKMYMCVFVCESTKAVHLEPVTELSTAAFLAAFQRFVSRRSLPHRLRSDNGRNFIGARRILKECQQFLKEHSEEICSFLSSREVIWELNPAYSPHFGGLHEAAIKSAKLLFYKVVGDTTLTIEEFTTLLCRIEAVLNSRPLSFLSTDPKEGVDFLSPGHFLVGGPLVAVPEQPTDIQTPPTNRWELVQQLSQTFWKRYHQEYLHSLLTREKWTRSSSNLVKGQIVYVCGEKSSPLTWPLGKVMNTYPGADGVVRVADVKIGGSVVRRAVHKLIIVPVGSEF